MVIEMILQPNFNKSFRKMVVLKTYKSDGFAIVLDHFIPTKDIASANQTKISKRFCNETQS